MKTIYLIYHSIGGASLDDSSGIFSRSVNAFEEDCKFISDFNRKEQNRQIILTFDDGYADNLYAAQLAQDKYNLHSLLFICTQYIDKCGFISLGSLTSLHQNQNNMIQIGFHGTDHTPFDLLSLSDLQVHCADWYRLQNELKFTENTKRQPTQVSLPHGRYNQKVLNNLREFGFTSIYTSNGGFNSEYIQSKVQFKPLIRRNCVTRDLKTESLLKFTTSRHHYTEVAKAFLRQLRRKKFFS